MEQQNQQRRGSIDQVNAGIGKIQNARFKLQIAKFLATQLAKKGATAAAGATIEVWGPILLIIGLCLLAIIVFILVFGGGGQSQTGTNMPFPTTPSSYIPGVSTVPGPSQANTSVTGNPQITPGGGGIPAPPVPGDIKQAIINTFGITMNSFDDQHLQWAWEKFWEASGTKFTDYIRGSIITINSEGFSRQTGCPNTGSPAVKLETSFKGDYFKFNLTHELGHVISNCFHVKQYDFMNAYSTLGAMSGYGSCSGDWGEDYAEMVAYYLNPNAGETNAFLSCSVNRKPLNPFFQGGLTGLRHTTFLNIAKSVLDK